MCVCECAYSYTLALECIVPLSSHSHSSSFCLFVLTLPFSVSLFPPYDCNRAAATGERKSSGDGSPEKKQQQWQLTLAFSLSPVTKRATLPSHTLTHAPWLTEFSFTPSLPFIQVRRRTLAASAALPPPLVIPDTCCSSFSSLTPSARSSPVFGLRSEKECSS